MSEEFNKEAHHENVVDDALHTEASERTQNQMSSDFQSGQGTTYSWVNPKIRQGASNSSSEDRYLWNNESENFWKTNTNADPSPSQDQEKQSQGSQQMQNQLNDQINDQNKQKDQCSTYQKGEDTMSGIAGRKTKKVEAKKLMSTGKRWVINVVMALVFGLIAGSVFYGVNIVSNAFSRRSDVTKNTSMPARIPNTDIVDNSKTDSTDTNANSGSVSSVVENAMPSLVTIATMSLEEMRNFFGGTQSYQVEGAGSGVIVGENETELLIATNNHVISGATSLSVGFIDETSTEAKIKGADASKDLAIVTVKLENISKETMKKIKVATLGNSDKLTLGEKVVAIGNALGYG
ncbi:MAG: trypsin-like peptidase domain-containing protein [Lachnospiraceae bacterium]|nr:trypsin-like peptidase domain-containing protein [Lachnospiraceae bacterium]